MPAAIRVENLSKLYRVSSRQHGYKTLRESIVDVCSRPLRRWRAAAPPLSPKAGDSKRLNGENFWALRDVSFEVKRGEVVGIIGRNGAGKSTLLKILSRITEPTGGQVELRGRVGSLLEVGTGFHPELTGRENVYMNGSILGMSHREIARNFDAIVAFSEIDEFLDTPVKRYSSGMYVRLAFAVAAHLEPEILIVDEVLAVGDATFQKRCLDRMSDLAYSGRTVLVVSHNLEVVSQLCTRAIMLDDGRLHSCGPARRVIDNYLGSCVNDNKLTLSTMARLGDGRARFSGMLAVDSNEKEIHTHVSGEDFQVQMEIEANEELRDVAIAVVLTTIRGLRIITSWTREAGFHVDLRVGKQFVNCRFHNVRLRPGHQFTISLWMAKATHEVLDSVEAVQTVSVVASSTDSNYSTSSDQGIMLCDHSWTYSTSQLASLPAT